MLSRNSSNLGCVTAELTSATIHLTMDEVIILKMIKETRSVSNLRIPSGIGSK